MIDHNAHGRPTTTDEWIGSIGSAIQTTTVKTNTANADARNRWVAIKNSPCRIELKRDDITI